MAATSGVIPLLYIIVRDRGTGRDGKAVGTARYTRGFLASTLQFMGCKSRHAVKVGVGLYSNSCRLRREEIDMVLCLVWHFRPWFTLTRVKLFH